MIIRCNDSMKDTLLDRTKECACCMIYCEIWRQQNTTVWEVGTSRFQNSRRVHLQCMLGCLMLFWNVHPNDKVANSSASRGVDGYVRWSCYEMVAEWQPESWMKIRWAILCCTGSIEVSPAVWKICLFMFAWNDIRVCICQWIYVHTRTPFSLHVTKHLRKDMCVPYLRMWTCPSFSKNRCIIWPRLTLSDAPNCWTFSKSSFMQNWFGNHFFVSGTHRYFMHLGEKI